MRVQVVRDELVVAFEILVRNIEKDSSIFFFGPLPQNSDGTLVPCKERRQHFVHEGLVQYVRKRLFSKQWDQLANKIGVGGSFDGHREFHCRSFHFHRGTSVVVESPVNDVGPMNELRNRFGIESETLLGNHGDEAGARLEVRIVKLAIALVLFEMGRIGRSEKSALV